DARLAAVRGPAAARRRDEDRPGQGLARGDPAARGRGGRRRRAPGARVDQLEGRRRRPRAAAGGHLAARSRREMTGRAALVLLAAAVLLGGLRDPLLGALGAAAAAVLAASDAPLALGPASWWLPWLGWAAVSCALSAQPAAGLP